jgi:hypothetical protein
MDCSSATWLPNSVFRSPAWRWARASWLREHGGRADKRIDDDWVVRARDFLAARDQGTDARRAGRKRAHDQHIQAALDLWEADRPAPRWRVEAHLLTSVPLNDVARICTLPAEVVECYHQLFFDVLPRLRATDWIMLHAVGTYLLKGFAGLPVGAVWKWAAYTAGPRALAVVMALTTDAPLPDWLRDGLVGGAYAEARFRLLGRLTLAAMAADSAVEWDALVRVRDQLRRLDGQAQAAREESTGVLRTMERCLRTGSRRRRADFGDDFHRARSGESASCVAGADAGRRPLLASLLAALR